MMRPRASTDHLADISKMVERDERFTSNLLTVVRDAPLRQRSRGRAALNLATLVSFALAVVFGLWWAGLHLFGRLR